MKKTHERAREEPQNGHSGQHYGQHVQNRRCANSPTLLARLIVRRWLREDEEGMKEAVIRPSLTRRRSKLGMRYARTKASAVGVVPGQQSNALVANVSEDTADDGDEEMKAEADLGILAAGSKGAVSQPVNIAIG